MQSPGVWGEAFGGKLDQGQNQIKVKTRSFASLRMTFGEGTPWGYAL